MSDNEHLKAIQDELVEIKVLLGDLLAVLTEDGLGEKWRILQARRAERERQAKADAQQRKGARDYRSML